MELPKELIDKFERQKSKEEKIKKKILATQQYKRRKLDKDVREYTRSRRVLRSSDIDRIGERHGFYVGSTLPREDPIPPKNA